jgi:hypothetical protein
MNNMFRIFVGIWLFSFVLSGCKKDKGEAPNDFIATQAGEYEITSWSKSSYQNNEETSSETAENVGVVALNVVNYGFVSEGKFSPNTPVNSILLSYMNPNNLCFDTFRWTGDENRISFSLGWCTQKFLYTLTLDGYKKNRQTWTLVQTDAASNMVSKEVFKVKKN